MLRVRPIHFTSRMAEYRKLLTGLGLTVATDNNGYTEFDAGSGRIAIHSADPGSAEDGTTSLGFEIRDLDEFIRRTKEAGTTAEVYEAGHGTAARIAAGDGLVFLCDPAPEDTTPDGTVDPDLSVLPLWMTPDVDGARKVLGGIGARPRIIADAGTWADYSAKNGGLIAAHYDEKVHVLMAFEYNGALETLQNRLAEAGINAAIIDENYGRSLRLPNPDGGEIWVNRKQLDLHGYTRAE